MVGLIVEVYVNDSLILKKTSRNGLYKDVQSLYDEKK